MRTRGTIERPQWVGPWRLWWVTVTDLNTGAVVYQTRHWIHPLYDGETFDGLVGPAVR